MSSNLESLLEQVIDQRTFLAFIDALATDFAGERAVEARNPSPPYSPGALGWENRTIDAFLDAAHAWGTSTMGNSELDSVSYSPWRRCAEVLYAGKYYE